MGLKMGPSRGTVDAEIFGVTLTTDGISVWTVFTLIDVAFNLTSNSNSLLPIDAQLDNAAMLLNTYPYKNILPWYKERSKEAGCSPIEPWAHELETPG